jgi:hypothetical protein
MKHWRAAKRSYNDALKIVLAVTPIHSITSAIYYRLGCVELAMNNFEPAKLVFSSSLSNIFRPELQRQRITILINFSI